VRPASDASGLQLECDAWDTLSDEAWTLFDSSLGESDATENRQIGGPLWRRAPDSWNDIDVAPGADTGLSSSDRRLVDDMVLRARCWSPDERRKLGYHLIACGAELMEGDE